MPRKVAFAAALALSILAVALVACGGETAAPGATPLLALDVKIEQPDGTQTILGATLLLDGKELARFAQSRPESAVVFSKSLEGVAPGPHVVEVRIDEQTQSPSVYSSGGFAVFGGRQHALMGIGGALSTGQSFRFDVQL